MRAEARGEVKLYKSCGGGTQGRAWEEGLGRSEVGNDDIVDRGVVSKELEAVTEEYGDGGEESREDI